ncbi:hypothetical protein JR316_0013003 [Psilocybe cubensis]|uniref:Uncharacterized protein n=1 Tax=Psilocybe cubensis TaxID=181762 RepID=A0ACB8GG65_PSICU|nr:hypothetical protein JR316_0013003 [Psilocybe cubensis]KAH9474541.1 hypothetical protein JR316_0013003 [Psilocybe cubensis]
MPSVDDSSFSQDRNSTNQQPERHDLHNMPEETNSDLPKMWNIEDPFQYAPPKPDGDPWSILLEPLLKSDKLRCDAWKDEVQNLLIFAGLFSAVVTTFLVESYKDLQADPNDTMIALLAHIAARLDNDTSIITSTSIFSDNTFVPATSTIRVNVFWFISLVLSLTTVLVGTISLQWLREHRSYSNVSDPREKYAIFHMRKEGLEKWRVDRIFTVMPLLLQSALVLFLGGLIDFLHAFSQRWSVVIPVAAVIGLSLLFLVTTTILPTLQTMALFIIPSTSLHPPSQCPFKSPQSHAVRRICAPLLKIPSYLRQSSVLVPIRSLISRLHRISLSSEMISSYTMASKFQTQVTYTAWCRTWVMFDKDWVIIRDLYMRRSLENRFKEYYWFMDTMGFGRDERLPLFDIVHGLKYQHWREDVVDAAYHCMSEVSQHALLPLTNTLRLSSRARLCENNYLYNLSSIGHDRVSITSFFDTDSVFDHVGKGELSSAKALTCILHQQNLAAFTEWSGSIFQRHQKELALLPLSVSFFNVSSYHLVADRDNDFCDKDTFEAFAWQFANLTFSIFRQACEDFHPHSLVHNSFSQELGLPLYFEVAAYITARTFSPSISFSIDNESESSAVSLATKQTFRDLFTYISSILDMEISSWKDSQPKPSLFFYLAACYTQQLVGPLSKDENFISHRGTILQYKEHTIDVGLIDSILERRLSGRQHASDNHIPYDDEYICVPFSSSWWDTFKGKTPEGFNYSPEPPVLFDDCQQINVVD